MLIRQIPDQVEAKWEFFAPAIARALPPTVAGTKRSMVNILEAILLEKLTVWLITDEDQEQVLGLLTTKLRYEEVSKTRNLLIYSYTSFEGMHYTYFNDAFETLKKYAVSKRCFSIIAYTSNEKILKFFDERGARTNNKLIEMEV